MSETSALFGSYAADFPEALTVGIDIDHQVLFGDDFHMPIRDFKEPKAAGELRRKIWHEAVLAKLASLKKGEGSFILGRDANDLHCVLQFNSGGQPKPVMHAGPLWTVDNPVGPTFIYPTDWTYFQAVQKPEYIQALVDGGLKNEDMPLMVGMHIESPKVPWLERPSTVQGRPGEKHPPSTSLRFPNFRYVAETFLFTAERLGQLGLEDFDAVLENCTVVLGQRTTFTPPAPEHSKSNPYLADYRFIFA